MKKRTKIARIAVFLLILGLGGYAARWDTAKDVIDASDILVFPGAEGFGVYTQAGRGGTIHRVTNLNNYGLGSLREACNAAGARFVIFEVSGTIALSSDINIKNPYITIAGQTAPYPGIQIKGAGIRIGGAHDVLIQHLRIRPGDNPVGPEPNVRRAVSMSTENSNIPYNVVIDHCSLQWGIDINANIYATDAPHDISYRCCIFSECLDNSLHPKGPHSMTLNISHGTDSSHRNISVIKNLMVHNGDRNPRIGGNTHVEVVNNVIYNCRNYHIRATDTEGNGPINLRVEGNHTIRGVDSGFGTDYAFTISPNVANGTRIYVNDNMCNNYPGTCINNLKGSGITWLTSPEVRSDVTVIPTSNNQARNWVLANVGAWPGYRDSVDNRIANDVLNGTGRIIDSQNDVGGWPQFAENHRPFYLPNDFDDDPDGDGYTNLEEWVHVFTNCVEEGTTLIAGSVTVDSSGLEGVAMNGLPGNPTTDASGNYIAQVPVGWSGTVTPTKSGYTFNPSSRTYSNVDSALTGEDYTDTTTSHTITTPNILNGPSTGTLNTSYTFTTGGSICSQGHNVEYRFVDWGDGTSSQWSSSTSASHSWSTEGNYTIKTRSRCSIDHNVASTWSSGITIQISNISYFNLSLSSVTGAPAPGNGGTIDPSPGVYSYAPGSFVQVTANPTTEYRFSIWSGDLGNSDAYTEDINLTMDSNKALTANFCTKCGDVNGDLMITPSDAQAAFDIFLGKTGNPTYCEKENADVDSSGTKTNPEITPGDAQNIFNKFLTQGALPSDCSGLSRAASTISISTKKSKKLSVKNLIINDIQLISDEYIEVPIIIDNPLNIEAFGLDLLYPSEALEFIIIEKTELTEDFNQIEANRIGNGVLRIGGYRSKPIMNEYPSILITLVFRVIGEAKENASFLITNTVDDFENASIRTGKLIQKINLFGNQSDYNLKSKQNIDGSLP